MKHIAPYLLPFLLFACSGEVDKPVGTATPVQSERVFRFDAMIARIAHQERVDPLLIHAIIRQESGYNPLAVSTAGAIGLMQLLPSTAGDYGLAQHDLYDPRKNIRAGAQHVRQLMKLFNGNITLVLAAYNAGQGNVIKYGFAIPPFKETQDYVRRVKGYYAYSQRVSRSFISGTLRHPRNASLIISAQMPEDDRGT